MTKVAMSPVNFLFCRLHTERVDNYWERAGVRNMMGHGTLCPPMRKRFHPLSERSDGSDSTLTPKQEFCTIADLVKFLPFFFVQNAMIILCSNCEQSRPLLPTNL